MYNENLMPTIVVFILIFNCAKLHKLYKIGQAILVIYGIMSILLTTSLA